MTSLYCRQTENKERKSFTRYKQYCKHGTDQTERTK